jgi:hypothetical protein
MHRNELLESIAKTVQDYRSGEIPAISANRVDRWISQFEVNEQNQILYELDFILKKSYFSRQKTISFLNSVLELSEIFGDNIFNGVLRTQFLNIQRKGTSQKDLLKLGGSIFSSKYNINHSLTSTTRNPCAYIYLDDCLFTGNTVFYDLKKWIEDSNILNTKIHLVFLAIYSNGFQYVDKRLNSTFQQRNIIFEFWRMTEFNNLVNQNYDAFWSQEINDDPYVNNFVDIVKANADLKGWRPRLFRPNYGSDNESYFSSSQKRDLIEKAFLKKGAYLCSLPQQRQASMRPMGYENLESLGFGSTFITYRNISNNCPLVLWWGDTNYPTSHPFSRWYPLFPRKTNEGQS